MNRNGSGWVITISVILVAALIFATLYAFANLGNAADNVVGLLPVLAIMGVLVLFASLAVVGVLFSIYNLSDKSQAFGLPEGSIRAVIALGLVVIFAILSVFLYADMSDGQTQELRALDLTQRNRFLTELPASQIVAVSSAVACTEAPADIATPACYTITVRSANPASEDFAKQLLVLIGTLVTAVTSFYFGSKAVAEAHDPTALPAPAIRSVAPKTGKQSERLSLEIAGDKLDLIKEVKLVQGDRQFVGGGITSNSSLVKAEFPAEVTATMATGTWDVVVTDGTGRQAKLPTAFTLAAADAAPPVPPAA